MNTALASGTLAWLLTYALHSTVLIGGAWLLLRRWRTTPAVADVVWKTALLGGILTATAQNVIDRRPAGTFVLDRSTVVNAGDPRATGEAVLGDIGAGGTGFRADARASVMSPAESPSPVDALASVERSSQLAGPKPVADASAAGLPAALALTWLSLALLGILWYAGRRLILVGRLGDRRPVVDGATLGMLETLRRDTGARSRVRLTSSTAISSPVALGGEICLPDAALVELDQAARRAMLAHELAHLERRDPQWLALACVLERAFFFQPLNRLARRGVQENAEYLADEWAARHSGGVSLAKALVKVAEWIQASPLGVPVAGFAEERSQLTVRVTRLLDGAASVRPRSRAAMFAAAAAALMLMAAFAPGVAGAARLQGQGVAPPSRPPVALPPRASAPRAALPPEPRAVLPPIAPMAPMAPMAAAARLPFDLGGSDGRKVTADTGIVRAVMARLRDDDAEVRRAAADALGRMRHPMAIDALVAAVSDSSSEVSRAALYALGNFDRSRVPVAPFRRALAHEDPEIRSHAVRMLGELRDRASIASISRMLADTNADVRMAAMQSLMELEAPIGEDVILRALEDRAEEMRLLAASFAGDRQLVVAVPHLIRMLDDRSGSVRETAAQALSEMRTDASTAALRRALTHKDPAVRRIAVEYFGEGVDP
ncbi:MAG: HEAT repeat domain-containing protein [Gemmatimonadetes bacterium]|nr:HEAT repeat domain-containing protein [Gemmatimonadota bacterium]